MTAVWKFVGLLPALRCFPRLGDGQRARRLTELPRKRTFDEFTRLGDGTDQVRGIDLMHGLQNTG